MKKAVLSGVMIVIGVEFIVAHYKLDNLGDFLGFSLGYLLMLGGLDWRYKQ